MREVAVLPPQESKEVTVLFVDIDLVEHRFNGANNGYLFFLEFKKYACQTVDQVRTREQVFFQCLPLKLHATIKHNSYLSRLLGVIDTMMRNVLHFSLRLFIGVIPDRLCVAFLYEVGH